MSDDQDGCEWVNVSSDTGLPRQTAVKRLYVCQTGKCTLHYTKVFFLNFYGQ